MTKFGVSKFNLLFRLEGDFMGRGMAPDMFGQFPRPGGFYHHFIRVHCRSGLHIIRQGPAKVKSDRTFHNFSQTIFLRRYVNCKA